jgi:lipoprotein-anchoring transpeptidase ErfK/SrfK
MVRLAIAVALLWFVCLSATEPTQAEVFIAINKAAQRMTVVVDGRPQHHWAVSTGLGGGPPSGTFRPQRMERKWFSRKYDWSPMPHSIFFHHGFAIHGTNYVSRLGRRASHGCVRLHPSNAATLFALVKSHGMGRTTIVVSDSGSRMAYR